MDNLPSARFQLVLLGRFELSGPDRAISVTSKKVAALLAFLACTAPRPHARDRLMTLLWGSHADAQARQNLRQALTRLRRILGDEALVSTGETVALGSGVVASDLARFEALLGDGSGNGLQEASRSLRGPPSGRHVDRGGGLDRMAGSRVSAPGRPGARCYGSHWASGIFSSATMGRPAKPLSGPSPSAVYARMPIA